MARRNRLGPVIEIAESRQQEAAKQLADLMQHQSIFQAQIEQLISYREDYKRNMLLGKKLPPPTLMDRQLFLARLNNNIGQVRQQLDNIEKNLAARMEYWQQTRAHTQALEKVVQRYQQRERTKLERRMQKEHDELASRKTQLS